MSFIRIAFGFSFGICFTVWSLVATAAPFENLILALGGDDLRLGNDSLKGSFPNPETNPQSKAPVPQEPMIPVAAIGRAIMPATIRARRVELISSEASELGYLVTRLNEIDTTLLEYQRDIQAESFNNLLKSLLAAVTRSAPNLSSKLERSLPNIRALLNERREINRKILKIVAPGESMSPAPYVEPTRSGPTDGNYQVYRSVEPATGAVVAPTPSPACHKEERTHREYRNVLLPNGFDAEGTALYRNEYHPFPVSEMVDVCK